MNEINEDANSVFYEESLIDKIQTLEAQLKEANEVIAMVEDHRKMPHHHFSAYEKLCCLTERANEYLVKFEVKEMK